MEFIKQDEEKVMDRLAEWIAESKQNIAILEAIEPILTSFEGQQITDEIEQAIKKGMPSYRFLFQKEFSFYALSIWGDGISWDRKIHVHLGCFSRNTNLYQETMSVEWFKTNNPNFYNEPKRLERYGEAVRRVQNWVRNLNSIAGELTRLQEEMRGFECGSLFSQDLAP